MNTSFRVLEFDIILQKLSQHAHGAYGREQLLSLSEHAKTIPNELLAGMTSRVKRLWV